MKKSITNMLILAIAFVPAGAFADTSVITNNVSVSASTGGNSAVNGEVIEGTASAHIQSETIIDGEVVDSTNEQIEDRGSVSLEISTVYENEEVVVEKKVNINGEEETSATKTIVNDSTEIDSGEEIMIEEENAVAQKENSTIFASIKSFLKYVFSIFTA